MSSLIADIVEFDVEKHPQADRLSIAKIKDKAWQCVFNHEQWGLKAGDTGKGLYIPIEAVIPESLIQEHNLANYVHKGRIRSIRLRSILSQGLLLPIGGSIPNRPVGTNLAEELGILKYEPPIPMHLSGEIERAPEGWSRYTDIENWKNFPDILKNGEQVFITEKLHGACLEVYKWEDRLWISSKNLVLKRNNANSYWRAVLPYEQILLERMENGDHLFGELLGVQDLKYGYERGNVGIRFFDYMKRDGTYLNYGSYGGKGFIEWMEDTFSPDDKTSRCEEAYKLMVPFLGAFDYSAEKMEELSKGYTTIKGVNHIREGIVIRPMKERFDEKIGRVILKLINDEYLLTENRTEYH